MTTAKNNTPAFAGRQTLQKLPANRGGYYYIAVDAAVAASFSRGHKTRLRCVLNNSIPLSCGLNPLGNGHYFVIIATRHVKALKKSEGDELLFCLSEDENPLGVAIPEVLEALLEQEDELRAVFNGMTDGKKRSLIFLIKDMKDVDRQVQKAVAFLTTVKAGRSPYRR